MKKSHLSLAILAVSLLGCSTASENASKPIEITQAHPCDTLTARFEVFRAKSLNLYPTAQTKPAATESTVSSAVTAAEGFFIDSVDFVQNLFNSAPAKTQAAELPVNELPVEDQHNMDVIEAEARNHNCFTLTQDIDDYRNAYQLPK